MSEDTIECPLCMEVLQIDDITFYPCNCGYQICRFCWHRIRTDEDGLCPACRQPYTENPAQFKPITSDEISQLKKEKKQKEYQERQKIIENRKHLSELRVIQKNLVFVVGLPTTLTDPDLLKRQDHFGKYGKIIKATFSKNTSSQVMLYQSAYITFGKVEDALRAIKSINQLQVNGKQFKASLGTTKYCSRFLKGIQCLKPDCMYVHEMIEDEGTFTKEEIQAGKHFHYEQKLYNQIFGDTSSPSITTTVTFTTTSNTSTTTTTIITTTTKNPDGSVVVSDSVAPRRNMTNGCTKEVRSHSGGRQKDSNNACNNNDTKNKKKKSRNTKSDFSLKSSLSETTQCSSKQYALSDSDHEEFSNANGETDKAAFRNGFKQEDDVVTEVDKPKINYTEVLKKGNKNKTPASKMTILTKNKGSKDKSDEGDGWQAGAVRKAVSEHSIHKEPPSPPHVQSSLSATIGNSTEEATQEKEASEEQSDHVPDDVTKEEKVQEDDLGFDPWHEISEGLDQMVEFEKYFHQQINLYNQPFSKSLLRPSLPPQTDKKCLTDNLFPYNSQTSPFSPIKTPYNQQSSNKFLPSSQSFKNNQSSNNHFNSTVLHNNNNLFNSNLAHNHLISNNQVSSINFSNGLLNSLYSSSPQNANKAPNYDSQTFHPKQHFPSSNSAPFFPSNHFNTQGDFNKYTYMKQDQNRFKDETYDSKNVLYADKPLLDSKPYNQKKLLDGLKAILPNVNISVGPSPPFVKTQDDLMREDLVVPKQNNHYGLFDSEHKSFSNKNLMSSTTTPLFLQTTLSHASSLSSLALDKTSHFFSSLKHTSSSFNAPSGTSHNDTFSTASNNYISVADSALTINTLNNYNNYLSSGNSLHLNINNAASRNALNRSIFNNANPSNLYNNAYNDVYNFCTDLPANNYMSMHNTPATKPPPGFEKASKK